ncbi:TonB family protein [Paracoccus sp. ME4]|uniref:energy transducer TonB family protein n=1 Tax=Paracoccus sp. ME4 TaxID=3138066 RepID=UPI00398A8B76
MSGRALRVLGEGALWTGASALVLAAHVGAGMWVMGRTDAGAPPGLPDAVFVDLAPALPPAPAAPEGAEALAGGEARQEVEAEDTAEEPAPEPEPEPDQVAEPIDPETLDLPEFRQFTPPDIPVRTALALDSSTRPQRRPEPREEPAPRREPEPAPERQPEPQPRQASQTAQAQGQGGEVQTRRASGNAQGGGASRQATADATALWGAQVGACIQRRASLPRNVGQGGRVNLALTVSRSGAIQSVGIAGSSGRPDVDQAALTAAQRAGRCPAAPATLTETVYSFTLPIRLDVR